MNIAHVSEHDYQTGALLAVEVIKVGSRHRQDLGDLTGLARSIAKFGLLCPITVTDEWFVVCGVRRLAAVKSLGWKHVPVWVRSDLSDPLRVLFAEREDEAHRKA